jgi:hypothetical protein
MFYFSRNNLSGREMGFAVRASDAFDDRAGRVATSAVYGIDQQGGRCSTARHICRPMRLHIQVARDDSRGASSLRPP